MNIILTNAGCTVDLAKTGKQALESFENNDYDLIFMDIGLPDVNGLSIIEMMRATKDKKKAATPIVITTAHADAEYRELAQKLNVAGFIVKPCTIEDCTNFVEKFSKL